MFGSRTKTIKTGNRTIRDGNPVLIQSICNIKAEDINAIASQIHKLKQADCDIIRVAVPTMKVTGALSYIRKEVHIPLVAGIYFDYRLIVAPAEDGADKIYINPGNIGGHERAEVVTDRARGYDIPIRVGVSSGSLEKSLLEKYGSVTAGGIVESALDKVRLVKDMGYGSLMISIKSSNAMTCVKAHELITSRTRYPLRVGITKSETPSFDNIKLLAGLGIIPYRRVRDTIRVSLTRDPMGEIKSAKLILRILGLRSEGVGVVPCPTYGCTRIDLTGLADRVETMISKLDDLNVEVAITGYVVNGPDKAREAGIGIADGMGGDPLIKRGEITRKASKVGLLPVLHSGLESIRS